MIGQAYARTLTLLSGCAALLTVGVAGYSLVDQSVYQPNTPDALLPGAFSQDLVSVLAALGIGLCLLLVRRGTARAWLVWMGLLGYLFYAYALYAFDRVYNPLFLFYIAIMSLSVYSLIIFFRGADLRRLVVRAHRRPPRKAVAVLFLLLVLLFVSLWLSILLPAMRTRVPPDGNSIFVQDLAFFLPLLAIVAVLLWRGAQLGDALAVPLLIKVGTLGTSVLIGTLAAPWYGLPLNPGEIAIYALLGIGPLTFIVPFMGTLVVTY